MPLRWCSIYKKALLFSIHVNCSASSLRNPSIQIRNKPYPYSRFATLSLAFLTSPVQKAESVEPGKQLTCSRPWLIHLPGARRLHFQNYVFSLGVHHTLWTMVCRHVLVMSGNDGCTVEFHIQVSSSLYIFHNTDSWPRAMSSRIKQPFLIKT